MAKCLQCDNPAFSKGYCRRCALKVSRKARQDRWDAGNRVGLTGCSVEGCGSLAVTHGLCMKHSQRVRRGQPLEDRPFAGRSRHPLWHVYSGMVARCYRTTAPQYPNYGGRGIKVCDRWLEDFYAFVEDMGERPSYLHTIDRKNFNGDYEPSNCRWATPQEQARNKRNTLSEAQAMAIEILAPIVENRTEIARALKIAPSKVHYLLGPRRKRAEEAKEFLASPRVPKPPREIKGLASLRTCSVEGCDKAHYGHGLCMRHHYIRIKHPELRELFETRRCDQCGGPMSIDLAKNARFCGEACRMKWHQEKGCYSEEQRRERLGSCTVDGCDKTAWRGGLCQMHAARLAATGDFAPRKRREPKRCSEDGCEAQAVARGMCINHYKIKWRAGAFEKPSPAR